MPAAPGKHASKLRESGTGPAKAYVIGASPCFGAKGDAARHWLNQVARISHDRWSARFFTPRFPRRGYILLETIGPPAAFDTSSLKATLEE